MSLKAFHLLFIALSVVLSAFLAAWGLQQYRVENGLTHVATAIAGLASAVGLAWYGAAFRRKARRL